MGFFKDLGDGLDNAAERGAKRIDEARYNSKINDKKREIEKVQTEIGAIFYKAYKDGSDLSDLAAAEFKKIDSLYEDIVKLEAEKEAVRNS